MNRYSLPQWLSLLILHILCGVSSYDSDLFAVRSVRQWKCSLKIASHQYMPVQLQPTSKHNIFFAMQLKVPHKNSNLYLLLFLLCLCGDVLLKNPYKSGEVHANPKGCIYLRCKRGDQCVNRKFWCKNPPCPNMLYCTKSRMESLKGPSSCESVRCSKGFVCLLRVRHCRWDEPCQQRIARCVSEREYYDGPASCVDFKCPSGLSCILRESLCAKPPCKLVKSCAGTEDVTSWYEGCKSLGCLSEHECFLRRPPRNCRIYPCKHTPDCSAKSEEELEANEQCRGWICPKGEECSALNRGPCKRDSCKISRSCHGPLMVPINVPSAPKHSWRDDVKLSFYAKVEKANKNLSTSGIHRPNSDLSENLSTSGIHDSNSDSSDSLSTSGIHHPNSDLSENNKIPQGGVAEDEKIETNSTIGKSYEFPIHTAPNYESPNSRPTSSRTWPASPDIISGPVVQPTVPSLSTWLNHLKLKTGVDAIEAWIEKAEKQENYGAFLEWLESIKDMLGPDAYNLWIEEVRTMTVTSPVFQKWLPPIPTSIVPQPSVSPDFVASVRIAADGNDQGLGVSPKPINQRNDEGNSYSRRATINNRLQNSGTMKNDDENEESHIFLPKNHTMLIKPGITTKTPATFASGIPSPTAMPITEWQQFDDRDPRVFDQAYPLHHNFGNVPWDHLALMFQGFDTMNPMKFQQPPNIDPRFLDPGLLQGQFSPGMYPQLNKGSMYRRLLESSETPEQRIPTNWPFQQTPDPDINSRLPNSLSDQFFGPINLQRNQFSLDRRFLQPGGSHRQFQSDWFFPDRNPLFPHPFTWQSPFLEDSIDQKFLEPVEYPEHQLQTNWSFMPSLNIDPNWQEKLFSPRNSDSPQQQDPNRLFNRKNFESVQPSLSIGGQGDKEAYKAYPNNSTNENTFWIKYFLDQISQKYVTPENIGNFPTNGAKFGYESWPESSYRGRSLANVPLLPTKPDDSTRVDVQFPYYGSDAGRSRKTLPEMFEVPGSYPESPWLVDPRLYGYYLHLRDQDSKNLYDKNNREAPSVLSSLSRTHKFDADARLPLPNPFFPNSQREALSLKYHWPNTYLFDRLYGMTEPGPLPLSIAMKRPAIADREYAEHPDPFSKINRPEVIGDRRIDFVYRDQEFDAPGRPMAVPDLWNSRFRIPLSSVFQKPDKEPLDNRDAAKKERPTSTTKAPPVVSTSGIAPQKVIPIRDKYSKGVEDEDHQEIIRDVMEYDDSGIYPLLLSLQGYIETSKEDEEKNTARSSKNSTILPVYKVEDAADDEEDYRNDYETPPSNSDDLVINLFQNVNHGGSPDFPNNLRSIFDVEVATVMKNTTGESDVKIKDIKWDYENDLEDTSVEDHSRFFVQPQGPLQPSKEAHGWDGSVSFSRDEDNTENDAYDDGVDYEDQTIPEDRSNNKFQPANTGDSLDHEEILEEFIDSFYDDPDHKTFKKNRP